MTALLVAAVSIALMHTLIGVDHYLPFVVLGRARNWSFKRVMAVTAVCGIGHCVGSVVLGFVGIGLGVAVGHLEWIEGIRGSLAAWSLIAFGLVYAAWSGVRLMRGHRHAHAHAHEDGTFHTHEHDHHDEHLHPHAGKTLTVWSVFIIFALGPCEPLIPVLMAPAFEYDWLAVAAVAGAFAGTTVLTMMGAAALGFWGLSLKAFRGVERYANVLAGGAIAASGLAIQVLGI